MRIALVTYSTRPRGSVVHTLALAEALVELGQSVTVFAVARDGGFFRKVDRRVQLRTVSCAPAVDVEERVLASIAALRDAVDPGDYDVVHAQDCIAANAVPGCIRTVHHLDDFTSPVLAACHERAIVEPRAHVSVSRSVAAEVRARWELEPRVIPNGVDAERFAAAAGPAGARARRAWRRRLGPGPVVVTVGGIEPRKGSLELLEAVDLLRRDRPSARLVIAGGETLFDYRPYRERFDARRRAAGVDVEVLGPVDHHELPALVASADVFALASVKEGFGLAALEALAARVPVVLREGPVLREVFDGTARLASSPSEMRDALLAALSTSTAEARARGAALAKRHTWAAAARAHLAFYHELVPASPVRVREFARA
ncbi:MAG: MSMEG_0565 family glycosyltransferase [Actinomycetota bacterium]|nr:MSMEG_0565 family glycosyltransferase [Actinomycetota bacterium]